MTNPSNPNSILPDLGSVKNLIKAGALVAEGVAAEAKSVADTAQNLANQATAYVGSIPELMTYDGPAQSVVLTDPARGGVFLRDAGVTDPDGGNTFKDPTKAFGWRRQGAMTLNVLHYGMKADSDTDNSPILNDMLSMIARLNLFYVVLYFPPSAGNYLFKTQTSRITRHYLTFRGEGTLLTRLEGQHASALFGVGRPPGTNAPDEDGNEDEGFGAAGLTWENMTVRHPALNDPVNYRPGRKGLTLDAQLLASYPDKYSPADPDPANIGQYVLFDFAHGSTLTLNNVNIGGCYQFAWFGGGANGRGYVSDIRYTNVTGFSYNRGLPAIRVRHGAGFRWSTGSYFANVEHPPFKDVQVDGQTRRFMEHMLTRQDTAMFMFEGVPGGPSGGGWDTWAVNSVTLERLSNLYVFNLPTGQTFTYARHSNVICDYIRFNCLDFEGLNGAVSDFDCGNMYMTAWEGRNIHMPHGSGYIVEFKATAAKMYLAGYENIYITHRQLRDVQISGGAAYAGQRLAGATEYIDPATAARGVLLNPAHATGTAGVFGVYIGPGVRNVNLNAVRINEYQGGSTPYGAGYGLYLGAGADEYAITGCTIHGKLAGLIAAPNSAASFNRLVSSNRIERWAEVDAHIITDTCPASGTRWHNTTPYRLSVSIGGGTVQQIQVGNRETNRTAGEFTLAPGESLLLTYTAAPKFLAFAMQ